jgi:cytochrome b involved in lipid metabolism
VETFSLRQLREHDTADDCFVSFQGKVYNFTDFVKPHDRWMNIRAWCGRDMTYDFKTKAGLGRDHIQKSYALLERFLVGTLEAGPSEDLAPANQKKQSAHATVEWLCFLVPLIFIVVHRVAISFSGHRRYSWRRFYRKTWISVLVMSSLPSVVLGVGLTAEAMGYSFLPESIDWVRWHVWGSIVFSVVCLVHALERFFRKLHF